MTRLIPGARVWVPLACIFLFAVVFEYTVHADSTITIPIPEDAAKSKKVTLSLRIPPKTEPLTNENKPVKMESKRSLIMWNSNPLPVVPQNDEYFTIMKVFLDKGWIKGFSARETLSTQKVDKYLAVQILEGVITSVLEILESRDVSRLVRKVNLNVSDIEDLRRLLQRFNVEFIMYGLNPTKFDKDLLQLQERIKNARQGILKVIRVEDAEDGGTVIHLGVE
ncbi:hypothetical protein AUK22_09050 [bacterium CG2_30_54_10]|nr:MAG: hypothetical protein AUK22_09050 [bacterium CG2_30_54_10]